MKKLLAQYRAMNLPNKLTILRMLAIPFFIACFYIPADWWGIPAFILFVLAYATDMYDGHYARKHNLVTDFGKLMDPMADKMLTASALIMLLFRDIISPIPVIVILLREFIISGCRLVWAGKGKVVSANWLGKAKTFSQFLALALLLLPKPAFFHGLGTLLLWVSVVLAIWSLVTYLRDNLRA